MNDGSRWMKASIYSTSALRLKSPFFYFSDVLIQEHLISGTAAPTATTPHKRKENNTNKWTEMKESSHYSLHQV